MANRRVLDAAGLEAVMLAITRGESITSIASTLGVSCHSVGMAAKELGLQVSRARPRPVHSPETRAAALARCRSGQETAGAIARSLGVSDTWVLDLAKAAGIRMPRVAKLSHRMDEIVARYRAGESGAQIARSMSVSDVAILKKLATEGVQLRETGWASRRWPLRHDAFSDMQDPRAAYWAGFLMADGTVADNGRVTLALKQSDAEHIVAWLEFLGAGGTPVRIEPPKARAQVSSRRLSEDLISHGVVPRKTYARIPASRELTAQPAFWRGMVDGDGTIMPPKGKHGPVIELVGSLAVMEQYATFVSEVLGDFRPRVLATPSDVLYKVKVEGRRARKVIARLWADVLNPDCPGMLSIPGPSLARKLTRAALAVEWRTTTEAARETTLDDLGVS